MKKILEKLDILFQNDCKIFLVLSHRYVTFDKKWLHFDYNCQFYERNMISAILTTFSNFWKFSGPSTLELEIIIILRAHSGIICLNTLVNKYLFGVLYENNIKKYTF